MDEEVPGSWCSRGHMPGTDKSFCAKASRPAIKESISAVHESQETGDSGDVDLLHIFVLLGDGDLFIATPQLRWPKLGKIKSSRRLKS